LEGVRGFRFRGKIPMYVGLFRGQKKTIVGR
jgi:hypothetical protein